MTPCPGPRGGPVPFSAGPWSRAGAAPAGSPAPLAARPRARCGGGMVEAWYMDESQEDQRAPHRQRPNRAVSLEQLRRLGVVYRRLDADNYETDLCLKEIRRAENYSWMDIVTIQKDKLPNYEEKIKTFYEEHLHLDDEIRYILEGSGYFDVRDKDDKWIRIFMEKGDMITLPAGIYHRFTLDENNYVKAMRLFVGEPVWTAYNRPADDFPARKQYMKFLAEEAHNGV